MHEPPRLPQNWRGGLLAPTANDAAATGITRYTWARDLRGQMQHKLPCGHEISELKVYQIVLGALCVASFAAGNVPIGVAGIALLVAIMVVEVGKK